eukprot:gene4768-7336_t
MQGKLKTEYDHNLNKLIESYYPKMRPLKVQVYHSLQVRKMLEKKIDWLEKVLQRSGEVGAAFDEAAHMQADRVSLIEETEAPFDEAIASLQRLTKSDLAIMRKYEHPPQLVLETIEAVMTLRGEEFTSWEDAKFLLCDTYFFGFFVAKAKSYDKDGIPDATLDRLDKFMVSPDFEPTVVAEASVPCAAICQWIRSLYHYATLARITAPIERSAADLEEELHKDRMCLQTKQTETAGAEAKLEGLQKEFEQRRHDLKDRYDQTMNPLQERFLEAHQLYGETFCSPRRHRLAGTAEQTATA